MNRLGYGVASFDANVAVRQPGTTRQPSNRESTARAALSVNLRIRRANARLDCMTQAAWQSAANLFESWVHELGHLYHRIRLHPKVVAHSLKASVASLEVSHRITSSYIIARATNLAAAMVKREALPFTT